MFFVFLKKGHYELTENIFIMKVKKGKKEKIINISKYELLSEKQTFVMLKIEKKEDLLSLVQGLIFYSNKFLILPVVHIIQA